MQHLDLFSGIGGFALAARWMGWETVQFVEREPFCQAVLAKHWPAVSCHDDVRTFDGGPFRGRVDLITGGFPCQPVSMAGQRRGAADARWLWPEMLRIVQDVRPRWLVAENVPGLRTLGADGVLADLAAAGYAAWPLVVGADDVGAVHRRKRVWIVAYADSAGLQREGIPVFQRRPYESNADVMRRIDAVEVADADRARLAQRQGERGDAQEEFSTAVGSHRLGDWRDAPESTIRGMDDGLPRRLDRRPRLAALGNAIVPQVALEIFRAIAQAEEGIAA